MNSLEIGEGARPRPPVALRRWAVYALMVLATIAAFLLLRPYGETLTAPVAPAGGPSTQMVGSDLKVISPTLFSMMVVMALVTTVATSPVLRLLRPQTDG